MQTRLLYNANKASFEYKEALFENQVDYLDIWVSIGMV